MTTFRENNLSGFVKKLKRAFFIQPFCLENLSYRKKNVSGPMHIMDI